MYSRTPPFHISKYATVGDLVINLPTTTFPHNPSFGHYQMTLLLRNRGTCCPK